MEKTQVNVRLTLEAQGIISALVEHLTASLTVPGRKVTREEVLERAIRSFAAKVKLPKKKAKS